MVTDCTGAVVDFGGVSYSNGASLAESRRNRAYFFFFVSFGLFVLGKRLLLSPFFLYLDFCYFGCEEPLLSCFSLSPVGGLAIVVLLFPAYFEVVGSLFSAQSHADFVEAIGECIVTDGIPQLLVPETESLASLIAEMFTLCIKKGALDML